MSENKFTQGEWWLDEHTGEICIDITGKICDVICTTDVDRDTRSSIDQQSFANGLLIAAAPDLLDVAERSLSLLRYLDENLSENMRGDCLQRDLVKAIAKAKGD